MNDNQRIKAVPKGKSTCPICKERMIAKCGEINIWHWSHKIKSNCDNWWEPESLWHINWKQNFSVEQQEVIIGNHIADIKTKDGIVIELQNSSLSSLKIKEREEHYKNMLWILNGETFGKGFEFKNSIGKGLFTFCWKHAPRTWKIANKEIFLDLGDYLFLIKRIYPKSPLRGYGKILTREEFLKEVKNGEETKRRS